MGKNKLLKVEDLKVSFRNQDKYIQVLRGIDIDIEEGEILGILGESGSGKTVFATSVIGLIKDEDSNIDSGRIIYRGKELLNASNFEMRSIRGREIGYIFQDPSSALNPYTKVGNQILEALKVHKIEGSREKVLSAMEEAGLDNASLIYDMYPSQLSGGQCQRVTIAMATILKPRILIADEPTTAIDASLQRKVIELLEKINKKYNTAILLITHDFDVAKYLCSRVAIIYGGLVVEEGKMDDIMENPLHPYTQELLNCVKSLSDNDNVLYSLEGMPPNPRDFKNECPFLERCRYKYKNHECSKEIPNLRRLDMGRAVRCSRIK